MVLLLETFNKLYSKLENHHSYRHESEFEALLSSSYLQAFISDISSFLNQIPSTTPDSESKALSFPWILKLFEFLPMIHQAFAKLVTNLEYPIGIWGEDLVDEYLNYTRNLLDYFNSITFALSQLSHSRLLLSHAISLIENSPSSAITRLNPISQRILKKKGSKELEVKEERGKVQKKGKESVIKKALMVMEGIGYWVCGIVISGCEGNSMAYLEMRKFSSDVKISSFERLDLSVFKVVAENGSVVKEVAKLNGAVAGGGGGGGGVEEMRRRLEDLEKGVERLGKEVEKQFSEVMDRRSQLLDVFRH